MHLPVFCIGSSPAGLARSQSTEGKPTVSSPSQALTQRRRLEALTRSHGRQVSVMPQCGHVAAVLEAPSLPAACLAFARATAHAAGAVFLEAYLSLAALAFLFVMSFGFAKGGGAGAIPSGALPPGSPDGFWLGLALRCTALCAWEPQCLGCNVWACCVIGVCGHRQGHAIHAWDACERGCSAVILSGRAWLSAKLQRGICEAPKCENAAPVPILPGQHVLLLADLGAAVCSRKNPQSCDQVVGACCLGGSGFR